MANETEESLTVLLQRSSKKKFCLASEVYKDHECDYCESKKSQQEEEDSESDLSQSLFESPAPVLAPKAPTVSYQPGTVSTPITRYQTVTPQHLIVDPSEEVWCQEMATPSSQLALSVVDTEVSTELSTLCTNNSCDEEKKERLGKGLEEKNEVGDVREKALRTSLSNSEQIARRLFHEEDNCSFINSETATKSSDNVGEASLLVGPCDGQHRSTDEDQKQPELVSPADNRSVDRSTDHSITSAVTPISLEVLFMNNSQLDKLDQAVDGAPPNTETEEEQSGNLVDCRQKELLPEKEEESLATDKTDPSTNTGNQFFNSLRFMYPTGTQINRGCDQAHKKQSSSSVLPVKRPRPAGLSRLSSSAKKSKALFTTPTRHSILNPGTPNLTPIGKFDNLKSKSSSLPTQYQLKRQASLPQVDRQTLETNTVNEKTQVVHGACTTFAPHQTSTPAHVGHTAKQNHTDVNTAVPQCSSLPGEDTDDLTLGGFVSGSGKGLKISKLAMEKARSLLAEDELVENHSLDPLDAKKKEEKLVPADLDWEEFNTFTQLPPRKRRMNGDFDDHESCEAKRKKKETEKEQGYEKDDDADDDEVNTDELLSKTTLNVLFEIDSEKSRGSSSSDGFQDVVPVKTLGVRENEENEIGKGDGLALVVSEVSTKRDGDAALMNVFDYEGTKISSFFSAQPQGDPCCEVMSDKQDVPCFTTAHGKKITVSEQSLKTAKRLLSSNDDMGMCFTDNESAASKVNILKRSLLLKPMESTFEGSKDFLETVGFTTASGKQVNVSEESLKAVRPLIHDDSSPDKPLATIGFTTASGKQVNISEESLKAVRPLIHDDSSPDKPLATIGFTTASGKQVNISEKSLKAVRPLIHDDSSPDKPLATIGFTTASGKQVNISEESLRAVRPLIHDDSSPDKPLATIGFTTASGKQVNISEELLKAVRPLIHDDSSPDKPLATIGFTTASGKQVNIPEESLKAVRPLIHDDSSPDKPLATIGFTTASGKQANISDESLKAVRPLIHDDSSPNKPLATIGFTTASGKQVNISEESLKAVRPLIHDDSSPDKPLATVGFTTASGKQVNISKESLQAVRPLIHDDSSPDKPLATIGFTTASGKQVNISEESLKAVRPLIHDDSSMDKPSATVGFSTASGKQVNISEESLKAVRPLIHDDKSSEKPLATIGFTTASGKQVNISEESLKAVRPLIHDDSSPDKPLATIGFTTASGKQVNISEESLKAVRPSIHDDSSPDKPLATIGFTTASGKQVNISEESLKAVRPLIHDNAQYQISQEESIFNNDLSGRGKHPENASHVKERRGRICVLEGVLCDRQIDRTLAPKLSLTSSGVSSLTTVGHTSIENTDCFRSEIKSVPLWKKSVMRGIPEREKSSTKDHQPNEVDNDAKEETWRNEYPESETSLLSPGVNFTLSQLEQFEDTTLTQLSLDGWTSQQLHTETPPLLDVSTNPRGVSPQTGSILSSRLRPGVQRIPLNELEEGRPKRYTREELLEMGVPEYVFRVSVKTATEFVFPLEGVSSSSDIRPGSTACVGDGARLSISKRKKGVGMEELWRSFSVSPGVDPTLISRQWFSNHYKWIVWKLASYEVCFPGLFGRRCLTVDWLMKQMKYRYDIEIDLAKRSIIHLICEGDDFPTCPMILCICEVDLVKQCIEVTDGWYSLPAKLDHHLQGIVQRGILKVGQKILICGAEMVSSAEHGHPLQVSHEMCLQLCVNSVKRAHWDAPLGKAHLKAPPTFPLSSLLPQGGMIPSVKVIVARSFPLIYMEKLEDGSKIFRTVKMEEKVAKKVEDERKRAMESICQRVEKECEEDIAREEKKFSKHRRRSGRLTSRSVRHLQTGEELYNTMKNTNDPETLMRMMSPTQHALLQSYQEALVQLKQTNFQKRLEQAVKEADDELPPTRNTVSLLRAVVVQYGNTTNRAERECMLTVWHPTNEVMDLVKEGTPLRIFYLMSMQILHRGCLQLSSTKKTCYKDLPRDPALLKNYQPRTYTPLSEIRLSSVLSQYPLYGYYDTIGRIVSVVSSQQLVFEGSWARSCRDLLYVTDNKKSLLAIRLWDRVETLCLEGLLIPGAVLAFCNLQHRSSPSSKLVELFATDKTVFMQYPTEEYLSAPLEKMSSISQSEEREILEEMEQIIEEL